MIYYASIDNAPLHHSAWQEAGKMLTAAKITQEVNKAGSFAFTMPPDHSELQNIKLMKSTVDIREDGDLIFSGRPVSITKDFFNSKNVVCEGNLNYLKDIPDLFTSPSDISRIYKLGAEDAPVSVVLTETEDAGIYYTPITSDWIKKLTLSENGVDFYVSINSETYITPVEIQTIYSGSIKQRNPWLGSYKFIDKNYSDPKSGGSSAPFYIDNNRFFLNGESGGETMTVELAIYKRKPLSYIQMFELLFGENGYNSLADDNRKIYAGNCDIQGSTIYDAAFEASCLDTLQAWQKSAGGYIYTSYDSTAEHWLINYTVSAGGISDGPVEFGVNLLDVSTSQNVGDIFTSVRPVGVDADTDAEFSLTNADITPASGYSLDAFGIISASAAVNAIGKIIVSKKYNIEHDEDPDVMQQQLYDAAVAELEKRIAATAETVTVSALDPRFAGYANGITRVGDRYHVYSVPHGLNLFYQLSKREIDLIRADNSKMIFGIIKKLLTDQI